jgi:hypothetical protein
MVASTKALGPQEDYAGKDPQHIQKTNPSSRQRGRPTKKQDRNCQTVINIWSWAPDGARHQDLKTDWPSVAIWLWLLGDWVIHRSPASRSRRRKGKSRAWDSKIWSPVPRDLDPRMTALARVNSDCNRQTRPLVRENAPHQQTRNCLTVIKIWS